MVLQVLFARGMKQQYGIWRRAWCSWYTVLGHTIVDVDGVDSTFASVDGVD